ncbi:MAG TPA: hypothetical protein VNP92_13665 [Actinophytocola sp.]|nr:hypothetical protein [Actinophytocola sp.]
MRTTRLKSLTMTFAAAAVSLAAITLAAGTASADTQYGPPGTPGAPTLPTTSGTFGNPVNIYSGGTIGDSTNQVIEVPFNSSASGTGARVYTVNGSNAQRIYFQRVTTATVHPTAGDASQQVGAYRIVHFTQDGQLCLDADGSNGAPGAGSAVTWFECDPNSTNQPNQLWLYQPGGGHPAIYNLEAAQAVGNHLNTAPVLANANITTGALQLQAQQNTTPWTAGWLLRDMTGGHPNWGSCDSVSCTIAVS